MALVPQDKALEAGHLLQEIAAVRLYEAQIEVAKYLELAYIGVSDHPAVAKEVRLTAHAARTQHLMTTGLIKSFTVTAKHIVGTMIPRIYDAVELEDKDLVTDCFGKIIDMAEQMKMEAIDTRQRYYQIQTDVQNNLALMKETNKKVADRQVEIKIIEEEEQKLAEENKKAAEELEKEKADMDKELEKLKKYRDKWMKESEVARGEMRQEDDKTFIDSFMVPPDSNLVSGVSKAMLQMGVNIIGSIFGRNKKEKRFKDLMQAFKDSSDSFDKLSAEQREILKQKQEQTKERLERLAKIEKLGIEKAELGDPRSLVEASASLGAVDRQFTKLIQFWDNMAATLKFLKDDTKAGEVYLKKLEKPEYADRFKKSINRADRGWQGFGRICSDYVNSCEHDPNISVSVLYDFLSVSIEDASAAKRSERMKMLVSDIKDNINIEEDQQLQAGHLLQEIAAVRLYEAQSEVAKYLELVYTGVSGHPAVVKEIRRTVNAARTQHLLTTGFMKNFRMTATDIIPTILAMIYRAVELEDKDLVVDCFSQICDIGEQMKTEVIDTRQRYYDIQNRAQANLTIVKATIKEITDRQAESGITGEAHLGDLVRLVEVSTRFDDMDRQFSKIVQCLDTFVKFWDNMVTTLKFLKDDTKAGELYIKKLEKPQYADRFKKSIDRAEKGWEGFGKICSDYLNSCGNDQVNAMYGFLF